MSKPKCPPSIKLAFEDGRFQFAVRIATPEHVMARGYDVVEYIPRHVADQQARDAVRMAIEAERAAQHREDRE